MKKTVQYGMVLIGSVLCLYTPVCRLMGGYKQHKDVPNQVQSIGRIGISDIDVDLPIFHGTDEEILEKGVGYIPESSPLTGGVDHHSILAGHRGLPNAELFLRLNKLEKGDTFVIQVSGQELLYEICKIQVIRPEDTNILQVQKGKDLVSLVTCTPYGMNTHRLVVTGERKVCDE